MGHGLACLIKSRRPGEVVDFRLQRTGHFRPCTVGILCHQLFPHHVEVRGHPAHHLNAQGNLGGDGDKVPHHQSPHARVGGNHKRVRLPHLHFTEFQSVWPGLVQFRHGHELVVNPVVHQQRHVVPTEVVLERKKAFRRVVRFHIVDASASVSRRQQGLKRPSVRREAYPPMHVQPQIGPNLPQVGLPTLLEHPLTDQGHPTGHPCQNPHIFGHGGLGNGIHLGGPVVHQRDGLVWGSSSFAPWREVVDDDGTQVPLDGVMSVVHQRIGSTEDQVFALVQLGLRNLGTILGQQILASPIVTPLKGISGDRQPLELIGGGA